MKLLVDELKDMAKYLVERKGLRDIEYVLKYVNLQFYGLYFSV